MAKIEQKTADQPSTVKMCDGPLAKARMVSRAPIATPTSSTSCTGTLAQARPTSDRSKVCSYCNEASEANPTIAAARNGRATKIRRRLRMVHTMRTASAKEGGTSSTSAAPPRLAAARSKWPRPGSRSFRPSTTRIRVGTAKTKNGARHPNALARPAPTRRPMITPTLLAARCIEYTRGRAEIG